METIHGTVLADLPDAVLLLILRQLPPNSVIGVKTLNQRLGVIAKDPTVWEPICRQSWPYGRSDVYEGNWFEMFRSRFAMPEEFLERVDWVHRHMPTKHSTVVTADQNSSFLGLEVKADVVFKAVTIVGMWLHIVPELRKTLEYAQFRADIGGWMADHASITVQYFAEVYRALQHDDLQGMGWDNVLMCRSELRFLLDMNLTPQESVCSSIVQRLEFERCRLDEHICRSRQLPNRVPEGIPPSHSWWFTAS